MQGANPGRPSEISRGPPAGRKGDGVTRVGGRPGVPVRLRRSCLDLVVTTAAAGAGPPVSPPVSAVALAPAAFASALDRDKPDLVMADRGLTILAPQTTTLPPVPTTRQATPTVPTVAPPTTVDAEPGRRPLPVITVETSPTRWRSTAPTTRVPAGYLARPVERTCGVSPVRAGALTTTRRHGSATRPPVPDCRRLWRQHVRRQRAPPRPRLWGRRVRCGQGRASDGYRQRLPARLPQQPFALSVRWWIADYASGVVTSVVATDASGQTWTGSSGPAGIYGRTGCDRCGPLSATPATPTSSRPAVAGGHPGEAIPGR